MAKYGKFEEPRIRKLWGDSVRSSKATFSRSPGRRGPCSDSARARGAQAVLGRARVLDSSHNKPRRCTASYNAFDPYYIAFKAIYIYYSI